MCLVSSFPYRTKQHHRYFLPAHFFVLVCQSLSRAQSPVPFFPTLAATNRVCEPLQAQEAYASWRLFVMDRVTRVTWAQRGELQILTPSMSLSSGTHTTLRQSHFTGPSSPNSRLIETLFGTGTCRDASTEQQRCKSLHGLDSPSRPILAAVTINAMSDRKVHPALPALLGCLS